MTKRQPQDYVYTFSGEVIYPEEIRQDQINVQDIAYALSGINRYNGHTRISVLRHSLAIYHLISQEPKVTNQAKLYALLHDAAEAYLMDVPVPKKRYMSDAWHQAYEKIEREIMDKFNSWATIEEVTLVKVLDREVVEYEMDVVDIQGSPGMRYPGPPSLTYQQRALIDEAYQWNLTESALRHQFEQLVTTLAAGDSPQGS